MPAVPTEQPCMHLRGQAAQEGVRPGGSEGSLFFARHQVPVVDV